MLKAHLKKGREVPVIRGHPWIFSGAIEKVDGNPESVSVADILDHRGVWLARGLYNPKSQIRVRLLTWGDEEIGTEFFRRRLSQAAGVREPLIGMTNAYRLVNAEGDFLPGLVVDRYADFLVCQFITAGMDSLKGMVVESLARLFSPRGIYERSEGGVREEEGLPPSLGLLHGEEPPELVSLDESGLNFLVDVRRGQKTGFFLDQRDNRSLVSGIARDKKVLNCFAYTGAFAACALKGGAREVVSVDSSRSALDLAEQTVVANGFPALPDHFLRRDVFSYLKGCREPFDVVILDPPSLAHRRPDVEAAAGGYKFLNLHALRLLKPDGLLMTFSCSQHISADLFQKIIFGAAVDSGRRTRILMRLGHSIDHPVSLHHPEGEYLKGVLLNVLE
jgi:23S rRNA (cytosine1962-C5)-methyltransferase